MIIGNHEKGQKIGEFDNTFSLAEVNMCSATRLIHVPVRFFMLKTVGIIGSDKYQRLEYIFLYVMMNHFLRRNEPTDEYGKKCDVLIWKTSHLVL
ncbi:unnamed protein product [Haemonchus placei]|uniref:Metallophos domain-containing protein n=1 Tax=Haemonchus placei TaxID=6290 RepID=A0A0N4W4D7_HAEPC|nr:unnamed protein product [Haemonchus placei]